MDYKIDLTKEYVYIINEDLKMSVGKIASQVSHVAMMLGVDSIYQFNTYDLPTLHDDYEYVIGKSIILKAPKSILLQILGKYPWLSHLKEGDAGLTEVPKGSLTCIGFVRGEYKELDEISRKLKLV